MALVIFNRKNTQERFPIKEPCIRLNRKYGFLVFNTTGSRHLKIHPSDMVEFSTSDEHKEDWYVRKSNNKQSGIPLRNISNQAGFTNAFLVRTIAESVQAKEDSFILPLVKEPVRIVGEEWYLLLSADITYGAKKKTNR